MLNIFQRSGSVFLHVGGCSEQHGSPGPCYREYGRSQPIAQGKDGIQDGQTNVSITLEGGIINRNTRKHCFLWIRDDIERVVGELQ